MAERIDAFGCCPSCGEAWSYVHEGTTYSRIIGLSNPFTDRTEGWQCPDCAHTWPREAVTLIAMRETKGEPNGR